MARKERTVTLRIDPDLEAGMEAIRARYGTPYSEQMRRGLRLWLEAQGAIAKTARPRAATRKRA